MHLFFAFIFMHVVDTSSSLCIPENVTYDFSIRAVLYKYFLYLNMLNMFYIYIL